MSRDQDHNVEPLEGIDQLVDFFASAAKTPDKRAVGTEHEKFGFDVETGRPIAYEGERGIGALFSRLTEHEGWSPILDGPNVLALERDGAAITLEPGGQLELSGGVVRTIGETDAELHAHLDEVRRHGDALGQRWTLMGMNPWDDLDDVPWMPKSRYAIMRRYLPTVGRQAHWMMKMTCTVQANFDYTSEADAMDMLRTGTRLSPIVSALFANSPIRRGQPTALVSNRMEIWEETDPARCGVPPFYLRDDASFADYVEYLLDVPMFFIRRDNRYLDVAGASFRSFMERGLDGHTASLGDFELHLSTAFPDVRMKRYIEVRSADAGSAGHILALPALWKGIYYSPQARSDAAGLVDVDSHDELLQLFRVCREQGLAGSWKGTPVRGIARELVDIARDGLRREDPTSGEERYLDVLIGEDGMPVCPAMVLLDAWHESGGDRIALQKRFAI